MKLEDIKLRPLVETLRILDISDDEYFGNGYRDYISNSRLKYINPEQGGSPKLYFEGIKTIYSDSLVFGSAVHELILQPNDFVLVESVDRPTAKAGFMADELYPTFCKNGVITEDDIIAASDKIDYYKGKMTEERIETLRIKCDDYFVQRKTYEYGDSFDKARTPIYLDAKSRERLQACLDSARRNTEIQSLLNPSYIMIPPMSLNEQAVLIDVEVSVPEHEPFILKLKAKLDNYTICPDENLITLNDLKTTGHYLTRFSESWEQYHYYRQMGMYGWMLMLAAEKIYGLKNPDMKANMLLISTVPNYFAGVYKVTKKEMLRGFAEFTKLLRMVAFYTVNPWETPI